jgi:hypothetical protein
MSDASNKLVFMIADAKFEVHRTSLLYQHIKCWGGGQMTNMDADRAVESVIKNIHYGSPLNTIANQGMVDSVIEMMDRIDDVVKAGSMYGGMA